MSRAFKASRIAWASRIPEDWQEARIVSLARLESGHTPSRQHDGYWVPSECTIPWFGLADVWQLRDLRNTRVSETSEKISPRGVANSAARLLPRGTVILSRTASVGFSGILDVPMATTQDFANFVCGPRLLPEYLLHALRAMRSDFDRLMMGSTHRTIYMPDIRKLSTPVPPLDEQRAIADFLDEKTAAIDDLIAKKERLLFLLDEQRQALITRAVTQGLDPSVPMKDSGVAWLGRIPTHWEVWRLAHLLSVGPRNGLSPPTSNDEGGVPTFSISAVSNGVVRICDHLKSADTSRAASQGFRVHRGDILVLRGNGNLHYVAKAGVVVDEPPKDCIYPDLLIRLKPKESLISGRFLIDAFGCAPVRAQIETAARTSAGIWKISGGELSALRIGVPPITEQKEIGHFISMRSREIDGMSTSVREQLSRLREYRQAVITAAVTGRLDVRSKQSRSMEPAA